MSQQEFESRGRQADDEIYRPQYPYHWSEHPEEGMPRDEPPGAYDAPAEQPGQSGQAGYQDYQTGRAQVPWWARPQPRQNGPVAFTAIVAVLILIVVIIGVLSIAGVVLGSLAHLLGVLLGAIFALLIFVLLLVLLILALVGVALRRAGIVPLVYNRRARHDARRMARRAARRYWRGP